MKRFLAIALAASLLSGCAASPYGPRERYERLLPPKADPGAVVATEIAFAQAAQEDGQWTAFRDFAADDAVMFVPAPVDARDWLKKQQDPPRAVRWQPYQVWSSCDGTLAVTRGGWQRPDGSVGFFTTVWRAEGRRGDEVKYRWVLDMGGPLETPLAEPDVIGTKVADCGGGDALTRGHATDPDLAGSGSATSRDDTLGYSWESERDGTNRLSVTMLIDGKTEEVVDFEVPGARD